MIAEVAEKGRRDRREEVAQVAFFGGREYRASTVAQGQPGHTSGAEAQRIFSNDGTSELVPFPKLRN
ncbi:MAG TPA: hypothetical protein VFO39_19435 [Candidatus Sulfotelmatobacter sp.]|nr:hypothetical protein [Candidatus Sulfotelmatobacter sp.]